MKYLLDTNAVIAVIAGNNAMISRLKDFHPSDFGISSIVMHELFFGCYKSQRVERNIAAVNALRFEVLELTKRDAAEAGKLRAHLGKQGMPIGPFDVLIAGQAIARCLPLVTNNVKEFGRVPGLVLEDWLAD